MTDSTLGNKVDFPSQGVLQLLEKSIFGVKKTDTISVAPGEATVLERIKVTMPDIIDNIRQIICAPTGKDAELETCLLIYDGLNPAEHGSPSIEHVIKSLSGNIKAFRWRHGLRLTTRDRIVAEDALQNYLSTSAAKPALGAEPDTTPNKAQQATKSVHSTTLERSRRRSVEDPTEYAGDNVVEDGEVVALAKSVQDKVDEEIFEATQEPVWPADSPPDPLIEGAKVCEAQAEAARAVIPVLQRNHQEEKALVSDTRSFLEAVEQNPLPTSAEGLSVRELVSAIGSRMERIHLGQRFEDRRKALADERSEAINRLQPSVMRAGEWLKTNGPKQGDGPPSPSFDAGIDSGSGPNEGGHDESQPAPELNCSVEPQSASASVDGAKEESSDDSDFEDQLRRLYKEEQSVAEAPVEEVQSDLEERASSE